MRINTLLLMGSTIMATNSMRWKSNVRKLSGSLYVSLPKDYLRYKGVEKDDIAVFELKRNGLLLTFRKPVSPSEEDEYND